MLKDWRQILIAKFSDIKTGNKIEIIVSSKTGNDKESYISQFERISKDGNEIIIYAPIKEGKIVPLSLGINIDVYFIEDVDLFGFKAVITSRLKQGNINLLEIKKLSDINKLQRREFFRFDCMLNIKYRVINEWEDFKDGIVTDISGGGICLVGEEFLKSNSMIECQMFLKANEKINFIGKVVRVDEENASNKFRLGIKFIKIRNIDKETIIRYIFIEQRNLRKKGLI